MRIGDKINNYVLLEKMGSGAFSTVWLVLNIIDNNYYALKIFNREDYEYGITEVKNYQDINKIDTTHFVKMIEEFNIGKHKCICMELMACSLETYNETYNNISPSNIKNILKQMLITEDILLNKMPVWMDANPQKAHKKNFKRFIVNWLSRQEERYKQFKKPETKSWQRKED